MVVKLFFHVGGNISVSDRDIIAILDLGTAGLAAATKDFISFQNPKRRVEGRAQEARSLIISSQQLYYSPISSQTLSKRINENKILAQD